ncbi:bacillithiol biosynthesis deacetylase BshB1 [Cesiribacter sp. SM1]|uniref:bacillithiol biosynthesis deacetylase BshB1 n=1 Tax=Cesiribacter sp. SM1 TaxID=2861196 RepID=UPI001CD48A24|nr:bacillithiol biosynthesis deacetylase BshB1 [Cesiribacter sp. SM1]
MMQKLDLLVITAHPDDAELCCSGTVAAEIAAGKKVGFIDLTRGELGTRGTAELRKEEAAASAKLLGISVRENLEMADGFFQIDRAHILQVVQKIRQYRPEMVITNAVTDRHPDHGRAAALVKEAFFIAGLRKVETSLNNEIQQEWRPRLLLHFIQSNYIQPDVVIDISAHWERKLASIRAFGSQFYNPETDRDEPQTFISSEKFWKFVEARAREFGQSIGVDYGEGFTVTRQIGLKSLDSLL